MKKAQASAEIIKTIMNVFLVVVFVFIPLISFSMTVSRSNVPKQKYLAHFYANLFNAMLSAPGNVTVIAPFDGKYKLDVEKDSVSLISYHSAIVYSNYFLTRDFAGLSYYYQNPTASSISFSKSNNVFLSSIAHSSVYKSIIKGKKLCIVTDPEYYKTLKSLIYSNKVLVCNSIPSDRDDFILINITGGSKSEVISKNEKIDDYLAFMFYYYLKNLDPKFTKTTESEYYDVVIYFNKRSASISNVIESILPVLYKLYDFKKPTISISGGSSEGDYFMCEKGSKVTLTTYIDGDYFLFEPDFDWQIYTSDNKKDTSQPNNGAGSTFSFQETTCPYYVVLTLTYRYLDPHGRIFTQFVILKRTFSKGS